jgi:hypothetical protein
MEKICFAIISLALSVPLHACETNAAATLTSFWTDFRSASLKGSVQEISRYYSFPLVIKGPYDDDKPTRISKKTFAKEYNAIFRSGLEGNGKSTFLKDLEGKPMGYWHSIIKKAIMPTPGVCLARIDEYVLAWESSSGWRVKEIYYNEDYYILTNYLKNRAR